MDEPQNQKMNKIINATKLLNSPSSVPIYLTTRMTKRKLIYNNSLCLYAHIIVSNFICIGTKTAQKKKKNIFTKIMWRILK